MTPVMILSDGYIANGSEPWRIPDAASLEPISVEHTPARTSDNDAVDQAAFLPYLRDELLARPWALPGTEGLMHRIGGLEKEDRTGNVSYDPKNHQHMVNTRSQKVQNVNQLVEPPPVFGATTGDVLVVSWGGTYGACRTAVTHCQQQGMAVSHVHLRWVNPLPEMLQELASQFQQIVVPELNTGQLRLLLQGQLQIQASGINKVQGKPFTVAELVAGITAACESCSESPVSAS